MVVGGMALQPSARDYLHGAPSLHGAAIMAFFDFGKQLIMHNSAISLTIMESN
jgi:hypothetical protein